MEEIKTIIKNFLSDENNLKKIKDILFRHNLDNQEVFNEMINQLIEGDLDTSSIVDYLISEFEVDFEESEEITDEFLDEVLFEIDDELDENYENKQKELKEFEDRYLDIEREGIARVDITEVGKEMAQVGGPIDLTQRYQQFVQSSLFQNILASQGQVKEEFGQVTDEQTNLSLKDEFYTAINAGDKIKVAGILRLICEQGKLRKFFKQDERYVDFFGGVLARHQGEDKKQEFAKDPADKKYLIEFLKFILEKRVNFSNDEAAMLGVSLGSLCREAGENDYADMAYGDETANGFVWG